MFAGNRLKSCVSSQIKYDITYKYILDISLFFKLDFRFESIFVFLIDFRVVDNGVETVKTYENDILKSHTVNGQKQAISNVEAVRSQHRAY